MHLIIPTTLVYILFGPTIPTYFFNLFSCFLYLFVFIFWSSVAAESKGCGIVHSLWHEAARCDKSPGIVYPRKSEQSLRALGAFYELSNGY